MSRRVFPRLKDWDILDALERHHAASPTGSIEWAFAREVPTSTGGATNRIDALAVNCWSSGRYEVRAYEVKVSRADWAQEQRKPEKSRRARELANTFTFAIPKGMIDRDEWPDDGSGIVEVDARGRVTTRRRPVHTEREPWPITFLASVIRSAQRTAIVDKAKVHDDTRRRIYAEILTHHAASGTAPDPDAPVGEWRRWAEHITGDASYLTWGAVTLLDRKHGGIDRDRDTRQRRLG